MTKSYVLIVRKTLLAQSGTLQRPCCAAGGWKEVFTLFGIDLGIRPSGRCGIAGLTDAMSHTAQLGFRLLAEPGAPRQGRRVWYKPARSRSFVPIADRTDRRADPAASDTGYC
jgi:hypothetical protein